MRALLLPLLLLAGCPAPTIASFAPTEGCEGIEALGWDPSDADVEAELLQETNSVRVAGAVCNGVDWLSTDPVVLDPLLTCTARWHAADLAANDFFDHESELTGGVDDRVTAAGYDWGRVSENIAGGQLDAAQAVGDWVTSTTGHCENLMDPDVVDAGMAVVKAEGAEFDRYWVQVFGATR